MAGPDTSHVQAMVDMACWYAACLGWAVLPCHSVIGDRCTCARPECDSPGKHPLTDNGVYGASTDETQIIAWWHRRPWANVAIATGAISGIVALDVDVDKGGPDSLHDLERQHGPLPDTPLSLTGGGGLHALFVHPGVAVQNKVGIASGLDVRGDGGYIVAPPSLHISRRRYAWDLAADPETTPIASLPGWLETIAARRTPLQTMPDGDAKISAYRNVTLFRVAGALRRIGLPSDDIAAMLDVLNQRRCDPPLGETEVLKIARSTDRYAPAQPLTAERPRLPLQEVLAGA